MKKNATRDLVTPYRVDDGKKFRLADFDPGDTGPFKSKKKAGALLRRGVGLLAEMQHKLYAQDKWALLLMFQAMDAAGKDGTIRHVMSGVNPQGCQVFSFKAPTSTELDHDYLWRTCKALPERGRIGIFNRSYYEETLIVRVHPELLRHQKLPAKLVTNNLWAERFEDINAHERYLSRNGIVIRKFFLHVSKEEQKRRFLRRIEDPARNWKFSSADVRERTRWDDYQAAYEDMIRNTSTPHAPWFVVPADHKWFTRLAVAAAVVDTLHSLDLRFPKLPKVEREELTAAGRALRNED